METVLTMGMGSLLVGLLARVLVPWLAKRREDPEGAQWSWRFVWPMMLSFGILLLLVPLLVGELETVAQMPAQAAWLVGWGAADIGRKTYKTLVKESD